MCESGAAGYVQVGSLSETSAFPIDRMKESEGPIQMSWGKFQVLEFSDRPGNFFLRFRKNGGQTIHSITLHSWMPRLLSEKDVEEILEGLY